MPHGSGGIPFSCFLPGRPYIIGPNSNIVFTYYSDGGMKNGQWVGESIPTAADWSVSKPHLFTLRILDTGNQCIPRSIPSAIDESTNTYATLSCKKASTEIKGVK